MSIENPVEVQESRNAKAFIILLITGIMVIVLQKLIEVPPWAAWVLPTILVGLYVVWTDYTNTEREGADNAYYLGFLYTLTSLGITLATFDYILLEGPEDVEGRRRFDEEVKEIMTSFGVALATTIAGIAGRLWLRHKDKSRTGADDLAERMVEVMHGQVEKFSETTELMLEQFEGMTAQSQKILEQANDDLLAAAKAHKDLRGAVVDTARKIQDNAANMQQGVEQAIGQIKDAATTMNTSVKTLGATVGEVKKGIEGITNTVHDAAIQMADTVENVEKTVGGITQMTSSVDAFNQAGQKLGSTLEMLNSQASNSRQQFANIENSVREIENLSKDANEQWKRHKDVIEEAVTSAQQFSEDAQEASREMREMRTTVISSSAGERQSVARAIWEWLKRN